MLDCLKCGKKLESAVPDHIISENQPYGGTVFKSYGQYGSTVFDSMGRSFLEITICDDCLTEAAKEQQVLHGVTTTQGQVAYEPWGG